MINLSLDERVFNIDEFEEGIQEIDILFNTVNTELIGDINFGTNFEQFLWQLTPSENEIKKYIRDKLSQYTLYALKFIDDIRVSYYEDSRDNLYLVEIDFKDPKSKNIIRRKYQFT